MSNLENITNKILAEARQQAEEIEAEAREFSDQYLAKHLAQAQAEADHLIEKAKEDANHKKSMMLSNARLQSRDQLLKAKQTVLSRTFDLAKEILDGIDDDQFEDFIRRTIASLKLKGTERVIVAADKLDVAKNWNLPLEVSGEAALGSGFQIVDGQTTLNFAFEDLIKQARESMEGDIISQLFSGEV